MDNPALQLYVDGSYDPACKRGGWGVVIINDGLEIAALSGGMESGDNSEMELVALSEALLWLHHNAPAAPSIIWSDAIYVVKGCNDWRHMWKNNGWKKRAANGKGRSRAIPNAGVWQEIDRHLKQNPGTSVVWCKGHGGVIWNERADALAERGRTAR